MSIAHQNFEQQIAALYADTVVTEFDFRSDLPVFGKLIQALRRAWNGVSARWYVRHYAHQQLQFQSHLIELLIDMQQDKLDLMRQVQSLQAELADKTIRLSVAQRMLQQDVEAIVRNQLLSSDDQIRT